MNFSVSHAEGLPRHKLPQAVAWLIKEPFIRQLMRISIVFIAILLTSLQMLMATPGLGQGAETTEITLALNGESLETGLKKIEDLTEFRFVYRNEDIRDIDALHLNHAKRTVARTLLLMLDGTPFTYKEMNNNILIVRKAVSENRPVAVDHTVTGVVRDMSNGETLAGVSVILKGTTIGTATDVEGKFSLSLPDGTGTLLFSYIGFATMEVPVENRTTIDINLEPDVQSLNEVVVTALGIDREERSLGYATQQVAGENLTYTKEQNVLGSLTGKVAGVQVVGSSGASMGGTQKIKIRGVNSINAGDQPLIVVDGTPISNANFSGSAGVDLGNLAQDINPEDIASVNVLKGPAASALYGIRGQYGVIMITTKKGSSANKVDVQLNSAFFVETVGNLMPYQNLYGGGSSQTWRTLPNGDKYVDMAVDESWGPRMDGTMARHIFSFYPQDPEYGQLAPFVPHPDNIKDYYETGVNINNGISVSGGGPKSQFRVSFNDTRIQGVEPNTFLKRNNVGISAGLNITDRLRVSTNVNYAANNAQRPSQGSEDGSRYLGQWFQRSMDMNRLRDYKYDDGTILHWNLRRPSATTGEITNFNALYWANPFFLAYENPTNDTRDRLFGDLGLSYEALPGLTLSGFIRTDMFTQSIESREAFGGTGVPSYSVGKYQNREMNYEFMAKYNKTFGDLSVDGLLGANAYDRHYTYLSMATVGGLSAPGFYNIDASIDRPSVTSYELNKQIRSVYAMVSFGYKGTYYLDASIRNDNSSALPPENNSYWYPSVSGSMVFSELLDFNALSFGKLRVSYAQAGSDLAPYSTTSFYLVGPVYSGAVNANTLTVPDNLNNANIKPSFANSFEAGIDFKFLDGRVGASFTYYDQINKNQTLNLTVSGTSGYESATINAGKIQNKGIEISLTGTPVKTAKLSWDVMFNIARNRNELVELYPGVDVWPYGSTTYSSVTTYMNSYVGKPFGSLIGPTYQRDEATGKILLDGNNMPMYTTSNHDFGTVLPDFTGGFQNLIRYGNFELAAMIDYQIGGQFFSRSKMLAVRTGLDPVTAEINDKGFNVRDPVADGGGVKVEGISANTGEPVTAYVNPQSYYGIVGRRVYDDWLIDASYIKLREVRLGYTFGKSEWEGLPFRKVGIAFVARNPAMLWQKAPKGLDPSEVSTGSQAISWYESGQLNTVRSYGINLNVTF